MGEQRKWPGGRGVRATGDPIFGNLFIGTSWGCAVAAPIVGSYDGGLFGAYIVDERHQEICVAIAADPDLGDLELFHEPLSAPPAEVDTGWWDVSEMSVRWDCLAWPSEEGPMEVDMGAGGSMEPEGAIRLDSRGPGWYRLRAHAIGHSMWHAGFEEGRMPRYFVQSWPEDSWREGIVLCNETWLDSEDEHATPPSLPRPIATEQGWTPPEPAAAMGSRPSECEQGEEKVDSFAASSEPWPVPEVTPEHLERFLLSVNIFRQEPLDMSDPRVAADMQRMATQTTPQELDEIFALYEKEGPVVFSYEPEPDES